MGVPKFYRWISERYPCLSEVVKEFQLPDFDNLYLDMNGVIHTCSHPNDDDPHFRIREDDIFAGICYYIEFLFKMIKPKKVFFMAVDGVAPRAKMNQQRGRRFRTAKTAVTLEEEARALGEELPKEARFDSNCITPGTPFMVRLHNVLKGFVIHKISTDPLWQGVRVYLSGHETPGEGEHKIMDFIRCEKSVPGYNPNTRHCLYGLDADLIMLGLCSHEPYFSLLREEVKFDGNKKKQKRISTAEETTFHLLHISLLRDYLGHEFSPVKDKLSFPFDLEKVIDDFVLMSFLVGNDFIPHLPQLHIHHDALPVLFKTYIDVLPKIGGYINEGGYLNLERFQAFFEKLSEYDVQKFEEVNDDFQYLEGKSKSKKYNKKSTVNVLADLGFSNLAISETAEFDTSSDDEEKTDDESTLELEFNQHKNDYYMSKMEFDEITPEILQDQAEGYVRAIQWNLHYYYNGVVSWSWYYPHHYSPFISDVKNFKNMKLNFDIGRPFKPFQQLLAVLPKLSKELLPESYQRLMCEPHSPLIDFYPDDFQTDLNGKQQEWEAVVLIPFINEKLLVKCSEEADKALTAEEKTRNTHGPHLLYTFKKNSFAVSLPSFLPKKYPPTPNVQVQLTEVEGDFFRVPHEQLYKGICKGTVMDKFMIGFPTLRTLTHTAELKNEKVKVFQMVSMKQNMILTIPEPAKEDMNKICEELFGRDVYIGWPHLHEAVVVAISDSKTRYSCSGNSKSPKVTKEEMSKTDQKIWVSQCQGVMERHLQRWGIDLGAIDVLVYTKCFSGSKPFITKDGRIKEEKQYEGEITNCALQTIVTNIMPFTPDTKIERSVEDVFKSGSIVFVLAQQYYGSLGKVLDCELAKNKGAIAVDIELTSEPDLLPIVQNQEELMMEQFRPGYIVAQMLGVETNFVSRITGTFLVQTSADGGNSNRPNIGLNLKFNRRNEEVRGFTKKVNEQWLYSEEVVKTLDNYMSKFADFFEKLYPHFNNDVVHLAELYKGDEGQKIVKEILTWLKEQPCTSAERQSCGIQRLDMGVVNEVDKAIQGTLKLDVLHTKKLIAPGNLYSPYFSKGVYVPDPKATYSLFDRVVNVCPSSSVPLGLKGTVIGIQTAEKETDYMYEILFDSEFSGAISIASDLKKGYRMPPNALINISFGERSRRQGRSPTKTTRNAIPRLSRSTVMNTIVKHLEGDSPTPVHILKKNQPSPVLTQARPFYKADTAIASESADAKCANPVFSPTSHSTANNSLFQGNSQLFVIPKANRLSGSSFPTNSPTTAPHVGSMQQNVRSQSDFKNFWAELKKNSVESQESNVDQKKAPEQHYGQKLSVEELFQRMSVSEKSDQSQQGTSISPVGFMTQNAPVVQHIPQPPSIQTTSQEPMLLKEQQEPLRVKNEQQSEVIPLQYQNIAKFRQVPLMQNLPQANAAQTVQRPLLVQNQNIQQSSIMQKLQHAYPQQGSQQADVVEYLRQFCLEHLKMAPIYTYHNFGNTNLVTTTISLPNGEKISGNPCQTKLEAASSAAEKALVSLKASVKMLSQPATNKNFMVQYNPIYSPHVPPPAPAFSFYPPPSPFIPVGGFRPPVGQFPPPPPTWGRQESMPHFDQPVMRHPHPLHSTHIPDSYVKANQMLLFDSESHSTDLRLPPPISNGGQQLQGKDVFFLPGGGIATVRTNKVHEASMFVPAQVIKNTMRAPAQDVPVGLSSADWPDLPSKQLTPPKNPPPIQSLSPDRTNACDIPAVAVQSSPTCHVVTESTPPHHPAGMTVLKPKQKSRIAANFQFA